jgi:hypothetical protein
MRKMEMSKSLSQAVGILPTTPPISFLEDFHGTLSCHNVSATSPPLEGKNCHLNCCISHGTSTSEVPTVPLKLVVDSNGDNNETVDGLTDSDWTQLMDQFDNMEKNNVDQYNFSHISQQAVKNGNKVVILNNCANITFNL